MKYFWPRIISLIQTLIIVSASSFAFEVDVKKALSDEFQHPLDIGMLHVVPQFEANQDPLVKPVAIEFFYGEIDDEPASERRLEWLKETLLEEKRANPKLHSEIVALGNFGSRIKHSKEAARFIDRIRLQDSKVSYSELPASLTVDKYSAVQNNSKVDRLPAAVISSRTLWTMIRIVTTTGGGFTAIYFSEDVPAPVAFGVAMVPAVISGSLTYFSAQYGHFLTNESWSRHFFNSDNFFIRNLRKAMGFTPTKFDEMLVKKKNSLLKSFPSLADHPELFEPMLKDMSEEALEKAMKNKANLISKFAKGEEYLKWYVTEVMFTGLGIKLPQSIAGVGTFTTLGAATSDVLSASLLGMIAQGPADIAIQQQKYRKIEQLKAVLLSGSSKIENQAALLEEIEKILTKNSHYVIHDGSHPALKVIETWGRSRSTMLSFFSVLGVGMEVAGIPLARPWLISVSVGGGFYYAHVNGLLTKPKNSITNFGRKATQLFDSGKSKIVPLVKDFCSRKFIPKK